mmetsp:Transcript_21432/g.70864  ORF Transcript_21432/g.70864 Transcript_21432/m.70864 type:complete len:223 (+) Transcript_21432:162-830(+)
MPSIAANAAQLLILTGRAEDTSRAQVAPPREQPRPGERDDREEAAEHEEPRLALVFVDLRHQRRHAQDLVVALRRHRGRRAGEDARILRDDLGRLARSEALHQKRVRLGDLGGRVHRRIDGHRVLVDCRERVRLGWVARLERFPQHEAFLLRVGLLHAAALKAHAVVQARWQLCQRCRCPVRLLRPLRRRLVCSHHDRNSAAAEQRRAEAEPERRARLLQEG